MNLSIHDSQHKGHSKTALNHYDEWHYAECYILFVVKLSVIILSVIMLECHYAEYHYAECYVLFVVKLSVIMLRIVMLSVIMLSAVDPCFRSSRPVRTLLCMLLFIVL